MANNHASYFLSPDGAIQHWLARGPKTTLLHNLDQIIEPTRSPFASGGRWAITNAPDSLDLKLRVHRWMAKNDWTPNDTPHHLLNSDCGQWTYQRTGEDAVIDFSLFNFTPTHMQAWVFTHIECDQVMTAHAELLTIGPTRVWVNGQKTLDYDEQFGYVEALRVPLTLELQAGLNTVYLHGDMIGWREARLALGLRLFESPPVKIRIPLGDVDAERWHAAENMLDQLVVKQFAFPTLPGKISVHPDAPTPFTFEAEVSMPIPENVFKKLETLELPVSRAVLTLNPGESGNLPINDAVLTAMASLPGENHLDLVLRPVDNTPIAHKRSIWASSIPFSDKPYGTYDSRKQEALEHVAKMPFDVLGTICAVKTGRATTLDADAIALACEFMEQRRDCADFYAVSLLAMMFMYGDSPALLPADRARIEAAFRGFKFWIDEPGIDAMCYFTENHQILFHVTAFLAGQYWKDWIFTNSEYTGAQQYRIARPRIEAWILRRLRGNFSEWDSNAYMALDAFALLTLVEFGDDDRLCEMAIALLDKIFYLIACQSFKGAHGSTHGRCYVSGLKSSRFENTSSLQRIAWGMGLFNGETRATGMLALSTKYRVPDVIQRLGAAQPDNFLFTLARSSAEYRPLYDLKRGWWDARTITRRTDHYMLSACVDHQPGAVGIQEHLWQATFSPEAVVFTTAPGNSQEHGNARPNFWAGSVRLPRVAMHDRTVICLYKLDPQIGLGISHAYFPTAHFDEYQIEGQWAFARYGQGYVALWSDGDLVMTDKGLHAEQELRALGGGNAWVCHVGCAEEDHSFEHFCEKVMATEPQIVDRVDVHVRTKTLDGDWLDLGWTGHLLINGITEAWEAFPHYWNGITNTSMDDNVMTIAYDGLALKLDLKHGRRLE